jgi:hypothetical protein
MRLYIGECQNKILNELKKVGISEISKNMVETRKHLGLYDSGTVNALLGIEEMDYSFKPFLKIAAKLDRNPDPSLKNYLKFFLMKTPLESKISSMGKSESSELVNNFLDRSTLCAFKNKKNYFCLNVTTNQKSLFCTFHTSMRRLEKDGKNQPSRFLFTWNNKTISLKTHPSINKPLIPLDSTPEDASQAALKTEKIFNEDCFLVKKLWGWIEKNANQANGTTNWGNLEKFMNIDPYFTTWKQIAEKINAVLKMRFEGTTKNLNHFASRDNLNKFIQFKKSEMRNQGKGLFGVGTKRPTEIYKSDKQRDLADNYNPRNTYSNLIIPTNGLDEPPIINPGSATIADYLYLDEEEIPKRIVLVMALDWFVENWRKKIVYKPNSSGENSKKWARTLAEKAKFGQERKNFSKISIVDCREAYHPEVMDRKSFFKSTNWQQLKESEGIFDKTNEFEESRKWLKRILTVIQLNITRADNYDLWASATLGFNGKEKADCEKTISCNIEMQTMHAWVNKLALFNREITNISSSIAVTANYLKSSNFWKEKIPKYMKDYTLNELADFRSRERLDTEQKCELGSVIIAPFTIFTPGAKLKTQM